MELPVCQCGHDRTHAHITPSFRYSLKGWILLFTGISAEPIEVIYTCSRCGARFDRTTDPAEIRKAR